MKSIDSLKIEEEAGAALQAFLAAIPQVQVNELLSSVDLPDRGIDFLAHVQIAGRPTFLMCEVKASGQPRHVKSAILQLRHAIARDDRAMVPIVIAPYLSEQAQALCRQEDVGYLDFEGNARISFDTVYIERQVANKPTAERRALRSLFKPKSARVLRCLLREPARRWRVIDLAEAADVSVGLVSTVGTALRDREWAEQSDQGLFLTSPDQLLDAWAESYAPPDGEQVRLYTHLHGAELEGALRGHMGSSGDGRVALASFSAAEWLAPYARNATLYLYADPKGLAQLRERLQLSTAQMGANIVIRVPNEDGVLDDVVRPDPGIVCTSPVQTYLDLIHGGDRGREAAEHLRGALLQWP